MRGCFGGPVIRKPGESGGPISFHGLSIVGGMPGSGTAIPSRRSSSAAAASVVPAQISVNLLSPAKTGRLVGRGKVIRRGKRLIVAEGEVFQGEVLVAKAVVTFSVVG